MNVPVFVTMKFDSYQEADEFITKWALEQAFIGQGFLVKKGSLDKTKQSKEPVGRNLYCKFAKCPWKVNLRKHLINKSEKWEVTSYVLVHNHQLSFTLESDAKKKSSASALYNEMVVNTDPANLQQFMPMEMPSLPMDGMNPLAFHSGLYNVNYQDPNQAFLFQTEFPGSEQQDGIDPNNFHFSH